MRKFLLSIVALLLSSQMCLAWAANVNIQWQASTDNVGVAGYKVFRDGNLIGTVNGPGTSYLDTTAQPTTTYSYTVQAFDAAGNISQLSQPAIILTGINHGSTGIEMPGPSLALFSAPYYSCVRNFYVATTGSDSNNTTQAQNPATPWLTIGRYNALATSAGGDCVNVAAGSYSAGASVTKGGTTASSTGYVVYRCRTLNGCTITGDTGQTFNSTFGVSPGANYVMFDGFVIDGNCAPGACDFTSGVATNCTGSCGGGGSQAQRGPHHVWVLNSIISRFGQSGVQLNAGEYLYTVHNTFSNNSHACDTGVQGSNISYYLPIAIPAYTPTADDTNNSVTGNTGSLFKQFIMWNISYNSYICASPTVGVTDGNGIILDDWYGDQLGTCLSGSPGTGGCAYLGGGLVAFNVVYNNGSYGIHPFSTPYATIANNSVFNNNLQPGNTNQTFRGGIDDNGSYGINIINNISYTGCGAGILAANSAMGVYNTQTAVSTTLNGAIDSSVTSITVAANTAFPGGASTVLPFNSSFTLPGGNMIQINSEVMLVTAGWGTNTWTVQRHFLGTSAASHSNGATINMIQNYWSNNVTRTTGACTEIDIEGGNTAGSNYSATQNKEATLPGWTDVGNTSFGTQSTQPVGANFALTGGSAAINYGTRASPFGFLSLQAVDAGACSSQLAICP